MEGKTKPLAGTEECGLVWPVLAVLHSPPELQITGEMSLFGLCWKTEWSLPAGAYLPQTRAGCTFTALATRSSFKITHRSPQFSSHSVQFLTIASLGLGGCSSVQQRETEVCRVKEHAKVHTKCQ